LGWVSYLKPGMEILQGLHLFALHESERENYRYPSSGKHSLGGGVSFFPRPHFEFQLVWNKVQDRKLGRRWDDLAWLLLHYYL
jgi:hypothetical protein